MSLTGNCEIDFKRWALKKYGYSDIYYLGLPVIFEFFDQFIDYQLPKSTPAIGTLKERILISNMQKTIRMMNDLYNEKHEEIITDL
tara:strand:+ start:3048 stop:3305 length:258 start_codon:yes stop_codon:yes gene_type:complete